MPLDPRDPDAAIDVFTRTAELLRTDPRRRGSLVQLPDHGRLTVTGDIHDHLPNFRRAVALAKLDEAPDHFLIVHELIHGKNLVNHTDLSIRIQLEACSLMLERPGQVLSFLANHDLAQIRKTSILKAGGASVVEAFTDGVDYLYGGRAEDVAAAYEQFVLALPLAVRCANRILCAHSLPSPLKMPGFDPAVLTRELTDDDYASNGAAHRMVWGRNQTEAVTQPLCDAWDVDQFILGHQPNEFGWHTKTDRILILDSQHNHAVALPIDLARRYTQDQLTDRLVPLASVAIS